MKTTLLFFFGLVVAIAAKAQVQADMSDFDPHGKARVTRKGAFLEVSWPVGNNRTGKVVFDFRRDEPLFQRISLAEGRRENSVATGMDPAFVISIGKRDLVSQNGWNIFFDKVPLKPYTDVAVSLTKNAAAVKSAGSRTVVSIGKLSAGTFAGTLEVTFYNGSPLLNVAAVMATDTDSTAVVFDGGLISRSNTWEQVAWNNTAGQVEKTAVVSSDTARNLAVKYRTIAATGKTGTLALFPPPHQYFYPLDEAFNLRFVWFGNQYRNLVRGFGMGIRQELQGDRRYVPWFNTPPGTKQRMNFFCLLGSEGEAEAFAEVKKFTHNDRYVSLPGFKTMSSHFHNEFVMNVVMAGKPIPDTAEFVKVFKQTGIDMVHLGEFHYTADPKGPDEKRLPQLKALFDLCERSSDKKFLLLPGEEPNEFFGGHWMLLFPKPVYWVMSRTPNEPLADEKAGFGKVYRVADKQEMLQLLQRENGLAWTAHARTKGSVNTPDAYRKEDFFLSDRFMGAAWKAMPADLSQPRLGQRVLDLMDDMNNWGLKKTVITEADLFTVTHENEMYAHLNVNYLMLDGLPNFKDGWQPVLDAMQHGRFFGTTGEVLMPSLKINGHLSGDSLQLHADGAADVALKLNWTFPMNFVEIISGDGQRVYREHIDLSDTEAFGEKTFRFNCQLAGRKWVRVEAWDVAVNGAFSQTFYISP